MRGKVLSVASATEAGSIAGDDGREYPYSASDIRSAPPKLGQLVDFDSTPDGAREVYAIAGTEPAAPRPRRGQGTVLVVASEAEPGLISGDDGVRYRYARSELRTGTPQAGQQVDFEITPEGARNVYAIARAAAAPPPPVPRIGGRILVLADSEGVGLIAGEDGERYRYAAADMQAPAPQLGQEVEFAASEEGAREIRARGMPVPAAQAPSRPPVATMPPSTQPPRPLPPSPLPPDTSPPDRSPQVPPLAQGHSPVPAMPGTVPSLPPGTAQPAPPVRRLRGRMVALADAGNPGVIAGEDGKPYRYPLTELRLQNPWVNQPVAFEVGPEGATNVHALQMPAQPGQSGMRHPGMGQPGFGQPGAGQAPGRDFNGWVQFYMNPTGRVSRGDYWLFGVLVTIGATLLIGWIPIIGQLFSLATFWAGIALVIKRLHDRDRSGWWCLLPAAPAVAAAPFFIAGASTYDTAQTLYFGIAGLFTLAYFGVSLWLIFGVLARRGTPGPNRFGPDPLAQPH